MRCSAARLTSDVYVPPGDEVTEGRRVEEVIIAGMAAESRQRLQQPGQGWQV